MVLQSFIQPRRIRAVDLNVSLALHQFVCRVWRAIHFDCWSAHGPTNWWGLGSQTVVFIVTVVKNVWILEGLQVSKSVWHALKTCAIKKIKAWSFKKDWICMTSYLTGLFSLVGIVINLRLAESESESVHGAYLVILDVWEHASCSGKNEGS